jgi:hypothetical protein
MRSICHGKNGVFRGKIIIKNATQTVGRAITIVHEVGLIAAFQYFAARVYFATRVVQLQRKQRFQTEA